MESSEYLKLFVEECQFYNDIVLGTLLPGSLWESLPHLFQTWLRNYIGSVLLYFVSGFLWCFYIYHLKRNVYLPKDAIPSNKAMLLQMYVAMKAMPWIGFSSTGWDTAGRTTCNSAMSRANAAYHSFSPPFY